MSEISIPNPGLRSHSEGATNTDFLVDATSRRPWMNEAGIIERAPTPEEARKWSLRKLGSGVTAETFAIDFPSTEVEPTLLGKDEHSGDFLARKSSDIFGYGNEQDRLAKLKSMDFRSFKEAILRLNNVVRKKGDNDAPDSVGFTADGRFAYLVGRVPHIYPDSDDTMDVLKYAFEKAKEATDVQDSALILSGGFVAAHPFNDGNGRVSRQIYAELSAGLNPSDTVLDQITASTSRSKETRGGAAFVNIGGFVNHDSEIKNQIVVDVYRQTDVTRYNGQFSGLDYSKNNNGIYVGIPQKAIEGLRSKQALWLDDVYANVRGLNLGRDSVVDHSVEDQSFRFALSYAVERFPGFIREFEHQPGDKGPRYLDIQKLFESGNQDFMLAMADGAREYYKQSAKSLIDMLGGGELAKKQIDHPGGGKITLRDRIIEISNNFLAESIKNKPSAGAADLSLQARFGLGQPAQSSGDNGEEKQGNNLSPLGSRTNPAIVDNGGFRGDPRRVPGHPSNPIRQFSSAYSDYLKNRH